MKAKLLHKLLVPLDGSELGEKAIAYAIELARKIDAEVQLACVPVLRDEATCRMCNVYIGKTAEQLQSALIKKNNLSLVRPVVLEGEPAPAVVDYAVREGIGLIALSSHGHSGIMPWAVGGTANKIIHTSHVPVLIVRSAGVMPKSGEFFSKILVPLDGSSAGEAALPFVQEIAGVFGSEVILLRVVESEMLVHSVGGADHIVYPEQVMDRIKKEAEVYLASVKNRHVGIAMRAIIRTGNIAREIIKVSEEEKANIVAMSTQGLSGIDRWMMGSIADKVLQSGKVPLLLVPPKLSVGK
jgi:nucleotide-binding universal stress UspA family protein